MTHYEPKISAVLNNCGLHVLVPEIVEEISHFAEQDDYDNNHNPNYKKLRDCFAKYYSLESFSFKKFDQILRAYNPHDQQIIMGPVLRDFLAEHLDPSEVEELTTIQDYGRYESLDIIKISDHIAKPLGFKINIGGNIPLSDENSICDVIYHHHGDPNGAANGGHFERTSQKEQRIDYMQNPDCQLKKLTDLFTDGRKEITEIGLHILKHHVAWTYKYTKEAKNTHQVLNHIIYSFNKTLGEQHLNTDGLIQDINKLNDALLLENNPARPVAQYGQEEKAEPKDEQSAQHNSAVDHLKSQPESTSGPEISESSLKSERPNYNLLLRMGAGISLGLGMAAGVIVAMAIVGTIAISPVGMGLIAGGGVTAIALGMYGLFNRPVNNLVDHDNNPDNSAALERKA